MFIDNAMNPILALQRSAMFPAMVRETDLCFAPLERGEIFGGRAFYKHLAPNGAKATMFCCIQNLNPRKLIYCKTLQLPILT